VLYGWSRLPAVAVVGLLIMLLASGTAFAATTYEFISTQNWIPPKSAAVELGKLKIEIDPLLEGEHEALFELPRRYVIELPATVFPSLEDSDVRLSCELTRANEFRGSISNTVGTGKYTFIVPIRSTIPSGVRGDIELTVTSLRGQLLDSIVVVGAALPGEVTIESSRVGTVKDGKSTVEITFTENTAGLLLRNSPVKLTLPEGFGWANAKGTLVSGEDYRARLATDGRTLELRTERESTRRATFRVEAEVRVTDAGKAESGEVRAGISGLDRVSPNTILVARYTAPAPEPPQPEPKPEPTPELAVPRTAVFTIGGASYTTNGATGAMDVVPYLKDGRTYLPLRYVGYGLGAEVAWDGQAQRATLTKDGKTVQVTVGSKSLLVNGRAVPMDVVPEVVPPGRIMLPYRFIAEALDARVDWDPATRTVTITR